MSLPVIAFAGRPDERAVFEPELRAAAAERGLEIALHMDPGAVAPGAVEYLIFAANGPIRDLAPYAHVRAILNLWAGVEAVLALDPPDVPIVRMVEEGMTLGMTDYVAGHVLRHHLDIDQFIRGPVLTDWDIVPAPPLARDRKVGILGLGALGAACGQVLRGIGFDVSGWARTEKTLPGIVCRHGAAGLEQVIAEAEILVLLLPLTPQTRGVLGAGRIALMPPGACLVNAARGPLIDHDALLAALDAGHLRHATMDVFDVEPLPPGHRYWTHPRVTVTPHIASITRPATAARALIAQIAADRSGEPFHHVVDRTRGY